VGGRCDGIVKLPWEQGFGVLEAKTIGPKSAWKARRAPLEKHVIQANVYMDLTGLDWAMVLYWDKSTFGLRGLFDHVIYRDDDIIARVHELGDKIWRGIDGGPLPEDGVCAHAHCARAKRCPVRKQCFGIGEADDG